MTDKARKSDDIDIDALFSGVINEGKPCKVEQINPSLEGWSVIIFFEDTDPLKEGTQAEEDLEYLKVQQKIGVLKISYEKVPQRRAVLRHDPDCSETAFSRELLTLIGRYNYHALSVAPLHGTDESAENADRANKVDHEDVTFPPNRGSVPDIIASMREQGEPLISEVLVGDGVADINDADGAKVYNLLFDHVVLTLRADDPGLEEVRAQFQQLREEEELDYEEAVDGENIDITLSKRDDVIYKEGSQMDLKYVYLIMKYPYAVI
ncbi:MAG TPA: hypothetical protein VI588_04340 [Candidatus Gracilibacteria bacterium]|nr:hypothetical protein [Candidatus Gracilibacteria bacterium]